jgi:hypothetical protein
VARLQRIWGLKASTSCETVDAMMLLCDEVSRCGLHADARPAIACELCGSVDAEVPPRAVG